VEVAGKTIEEEGIVTVVGEVVVTIEGIIMVTEFKEVGVVTYILKVLLQEGLIGVINRLSICHT
jgi:hypothetical protein